MENFEQNISNRKWLLEQLYAELVGPDPAKSGIALEFDKSGGTKLTKEQCYSPKIQANGEEVLWQDSPSKRYGAGVLFPSRVTEQDNLSEESDGSGLDPVDDEEEINVADEKLEKKAGDRAEKLKIAADESDDFDVELANSYKPSAMGLSFLADLNAMPEKMIIEVDFATYRSVEVSVDGKNKGAYKKIFWLRKPGLRPDGKKPFVEITRKEIISADKPIKKWVPGYEKLIEIVMVIRSGQDKKLSGQRLLTVSLVNRQGLESNNLDNQCIFQCGILIRGLNEQLWINPYWEPSCTEFDAGSEEEVIRLLYRDRLTFAIGHGCAANWPGERPQKVNQVWTEVLPTFETPSISADIIDGNGNPIRVSMHKLAGLDLNDSGQGELLRLVQAYENWISKLENLDERIPPVPEDLKKTAKILIKRCGLCLQRIKKGLEFLNSSSPEAKNAVEAFKLANYSMLITQLRASREVRNPVWNKRILSWDKPIDNSDPTVKNSKKGYWRAFQIAFLLMSIKGICLPNDEDGERDLVDLIWFPTGGGKTEAYLGLTSFTIFYNRLAGKNLKGADVIMRYTLRLLTAQQFQRAGLLFCAMEHIRRLPENIKSLGRKEFCLGMWVGGAATPNKRAQAKSALGKLEKDPNEINPFVLLKCPWCNSKFGPRDKNDDGSIKVYGYKKFKKEKSSAETVVFRCEDPSCEFSINPLKPGTPPLPIKIIDEDIIDNPPNLIIGTVDKFAMLTWKPELRSIFGIGTDGKHNGPPPTLIIQDELHLISGPLGSMVGAYETVIEELCSTELEGKKVVPKIVASTATISRADEQVKALYARENIMLFPPSGLEAGDSFFSRESRNADGELNPGRIYAGLMALGYGSMQTTQRVVYASLLQSVAIMPVDNEKERDPWWTLLIFFNSLRELGGAMSLLVADARDHLKVILGRHGIPYKDIRKMFNIIELTGRIREDHIPLAIRQLEKQVEKNEKGFFNDAIEVCLASSIIEVGVDIDRLSLMMIIGQPKTTSQYIQVSGRIGRSIGSPGLALVAFSSSKPRDRSHYERFRSYHQRLYAQVEPTSVTPFSPPAIERALHGIIIAAARQLLPLEDAGNPSPFPLEEGSALRVLVENMISNRVLRVDSEESENTLKMMRKRLKEWEVWKPQSFGGFEAPTPDPPLMHPAGTRRPLNWHEHSWSTLTSLRNVDSSCEADVTSRFNEVDEEDL
jgi:helicase-like protein